MKSKDEIIKELKKENRWLHTLLDRIAFGYILIPLPLSQYKKRKSNFYKALLALKTGENPRLKTKKFKKKREK